MHHRVSAPFRVTLDGQSFAVSDWSLGGFRLEGSSATPTVGSVHEVTCTLPFQGFNIAFKASAQVVRCDLDTGMIAMSFDNLGERESGLMQHFIEDLIRGSMTEIQDTIVRIDTPVTPVPTTPDPNPVNQMPVRRWPVRQLMMTSFYLVLGMLVFGYIAIFAFASLFRIEVTSALVTAQRMEVTAPVSGQILAQPALINSHVEQGDILVRFDNADIEKSRRQAFAAVMNAKAQLTEASLRLEEEQYRAEGYDVVARNNIRQATSQLDSLELARDSAGLKLERYKKLFERGLTLKSDLETAELEYAEAISKLARKQIHVNELKDLLASGGSVKLYTGTAFAGRLAEAEALVSRLKTELEFREAALSELDAATSETVLRAPFDGLVREASFVAGSTVKQGVTVLVLEQTGKERVVAYLTQSEINQLRLGSEAKLYVPAEDRWINARVTNVDRTDGFVDQVTETHRFRSPDARSAQAVLESDAALPSAGTPITVYFERHRATRVWRALSSWWNSP